ADKLQQLQQIIIQCTGLNIEAISTKQFAAVGDSISVSMRVAELSDSASADVISSLYIDGDSLCSMNYQASGNYAITNCKAIVPSNTKISGPYWLENTPGVGMYNVPNQQLRNLPQNPPQVTLRLRLHIYHTPPKSSTDALKKYIQRNEISFYTEIPVFYENVDPVKGDMFSLTRIVPPAIMNPER